MTVPYKSGLCDGLVLPGKAIDDYHKVENRQEGLVNKLSCYLAMDSTWPRRPQEMR